MLQPNDAPEPRRGPVARAVDWLDDPHRKARKAEKRRRRLDGAPGYEAVRRPRVEVRACETCGLDIPQARLRALPDATECLECERETTAGPQRSWNVSELERLARAHGGRDVGLDEEWRFLLAYLGQLADDEGNLSPDFDSLVRESFLDQIAGAQ